MSWPQMLGPRHQRLLKRRDFDLLFHAFGGDCSTRTLARATSEVLCPATAAFVSGYGVLGFARTRGGQVRAAPFAEMLRNELGRLTHQSPGG